MTMMSIFALVLFVTVAWPSQVKAKGECVDAADSCAIVDSAACKVNNSYDGQKTTTVVGITCQAWSSDDPHPVEPQDKKVGNHNKCRNHDGDPLGPWCYTSDPVQEWAYCFKSCADESKCIEEKDIINYEGTKSTTVNDMPCQVWSSVLDPEYKVVGSHSFCRNPDEDPRGPWCYTVDTEKEWDYCFTKC